MKTLLILLSNLFFIGCTSKLEYHPVEAHKAAKNANETCYYIMSPPEVQGGYCLKYCGKYKGGC